MTTCCETDDNPVYIAPPIRRRPTVDSSPVPQLAAARDEAVWAETLESPSALQQPVTSVRYGLRSLFLFITGLSVFFAVLSRLGIDPGSLVLGLFIFSGVALFGMLCIESSWELTSRRQRIHNKDRTIRSCEDPPSPGDESYDCAAELW